MSVWYIPVSEIIAYGEHVGHIEDCLDDFIYVVQALDVEYVKLTSAKNNNKK